MGLRTFVLNSQFPRRVRTAASASIWTFYVFSHFLTLPLYQKLQDWLVAGLLGCCTTIFEMRLML